VPSRYHLNSPFCAAHSVTDNHRSAL